LIYQFVRSAGAVHLHTEERRGTGAGRGEEGTFIPRNVNDARDVIVKHSSIVPMDVATLVEGVTAVT
tara:strand:+ start:681 stop:881 length:201 start_codon:yes stop_codon:yes gene_type:complete